MSPPRANSRALGKIAEEDDRSETSGPLCFAALTRWRWWPVLLVALQVHPAIISRREANILPSTTVHRFFCSRYPFLCQQLSSIAFINLCDYHKPTLAVQQPPQRCAEPFKHARHHCPEPCPLPRATSSPTAPCASTASSDLSSPPSHAACTSHRCSEMHPPTSKRPSLKMCNRLSQSSRTFKIRESSTATLSRT